MDKKNEKIIVWAGVALAGFVVYQVVRGTGSILESLGLKDSSESKGLNQVTQDSSSPWTINFYKNAPAGSLIMTYSTAADMAQAIWNSFGPWQDDREKVIGVIRSLKTQAALSFLVQVFYDTYGMDLLTYLRGTVWPYDRLSDADVYALNQFVYSLPKYRL